MGLPPAGFHNGTIALHAGYDVDAATKAVAVPIYQTVAYAFDSAEHGAALFNLEVEDTGTPASVTQQSACWNGGSLRSRGVLRRSASAADRPPCIMRCSTWPRWVGISSPSPSSTGRRVHSSLTCCRASASPCDLRTAMLPRP
jgi:Cys/Met metabolism PLP-dependent enzyme